MLALVLRAGACASASASASASAAIASLASSPLSAPPAPSPRSGPSPSVLLAFLGPSDPSVPQPGAKDLSPSDAIEAELAATPGLSIGLFSAAQGSYTAAQLVLDITQGARISTSSYSAGPPPVALRPSGQGASVEPWPALIARARGVPEDLRPGLLASSIPGGGAYVGIARAGDLDGVTAADRSGAIAEVSIGPEVTLAARIASARERKRLVVVDLPADPSGISELHALTVSRQPGELVIVVQRATAAASGSALLWAGVAGLGAGHTLTSQTTEQKGLIASIDLAPTILRHLGLPVPVAMSGRQIETTGTFDGSHLRSLRTRLLVLYPRRLPALAFLLGLWALSALAVRILPIGRRSRASARARVARVGGLALLWTPVAVLVPAAFGPGRWLEYLLLAVLCLSLGALSDRLPWPRAPLLPAIVAVVAITVDALAGTQLLARSLLGPNPAFGVRFHGIGNELKSGLAVLVFVGVAAALYPVAAGGATGGRPRRPAVAMALAGVALAIVEGSARIGAGVGGVILVCVGAAVATILLMPTLVDEPGETKHRDMGARRRWLTAKRTLIVLASPIVGLVVLAALDLAFAHGGGHYTGSVLHAHSAADLRDIVERRYAGAYGELTHGLMPVATALALLACVIGIRRRKRLLEPVDGDPAWAAAFAGGLAAGVAGTLSEDSGPVLLVVAVFTLACILAYLHGRPSHPKLTA